MQAEEEEVERIPPPNNRSRHRGVRVAAHAALTPLTPQWRARMDTCGRLRLHPQHPRARHTVYWFIKAYRMVTNISRGLKCAC